MAGFRYTVQTHYFPSFKKTEGYETVEKTDSHEQAIRQCTMWLAKDGVKSVRIYDHLFGQPIFSMNK